MFHIRVESSQRVLAPIFAKKMFPMERKQAVALQGQAHRLGFSSPHLRGCLFMIAGGTKLSGAHTGRYLETLGLIHSDQTISLTGVKLLEFMDQNCTSKVGLGYQESTNVDVAKTTIKKASGFRGLVSNIR